MKVVNGILVGIEPGYIKNGSFHSWEGITSISDYEFAQRKSLTSLVLSPNITSIGRFAFAGCESLTSLVLSPNTTSIGAFAFEGCTSLGWFVLPPGITEIGIGAFSNCNTLQSIFIPSCDETTRARIIALLPEELHSKVVAVGLLEKILSIRDTQLQRIVRTANTNPMKRTAKSGMPIPDDALNAITVFLGEDNRFLSKARSQIEALPLPINDNEFSDYEQKVQLIVDEAIARSKSGIASPIISKVLEHLKSLEDKASDLSNIGEEEAARVLQDLCAEVWALLSDSLDDDAFQEKCKQAIEQKREVLGGVKSVSNSVGSDPAFFKTNNPNLLDALMETIEQKAPKQSPSQSTR